MDMDMEVSRPAAISSRSDDASSRVSGSSSATFSPPSSSGTFVRRGAFDSSSGLSSSVFDSTSTSHSMSGEEETISYRTRVRRKLPNNYKGSQHLLMLLITSALGMVLPLLSWASGSGSVRTMAMVVPAMLAYANLVEYFLHRFAGHEWRAKGNSVLRTFRFLHAIVHHSFFDCGAEAHTPITPSQAPLSPRATPSPMMRIEVENDLFFVLFPMWVYGLWACLACLPLLLTALWCWWHGTQEQPSAIASGDARTIHLVVSCLSFSLLQYEVLHTFHHDGLPKGLQSALEALPAFRRMKLRHRIHHSGGKRGCCYNITWPLADWLFGTLEPEGVWDAQKSS